MNQTDREKLTLACCGSTFLSSASKSFLVHTSIQLAENVYLSMSCFHDDSCSKASCSLVGGVRGGRDVKGGGLIEVRDEGKEVQRGREQGVSA